jgi:CheY-like chemotaxis protein
MPDRKILLIDDDPDILESIALVLSAEGFEVLRASSAAEGIDAAEQSLPDLIVCDMMMESIDAGMQAAETIRERLPHVPIFLLSSIGEVTAATNDIADIGFRKVFQKPVDPADLVANIKSILGS